MINDTHIVIMTDAIFDECKRLYEIDRNEQEEKYYKACCKAFSALEEMLAEYDDLYEDKALKQAFEDLFKENEELMDDIPKPTSKEIMTWHIQANEKRMIVGKEPYEIPSEEDINRYADIANKKK